MVPTANPALVSQTMCAIKVVNVRGQAQGREMVSAVVTLDMKEISAILALLRTTSHIKMSRNCCALLATHLARGLVLRQALKGVLCAVLAGSWTQRRAVWM